MMAALNAKVVAFVMVVALLLGNTATVEGSWSDGTGGGAGDPGSPGASGTGGGGGGGGGGGNHHGGGGRGEL